ncbi:MAG: tetratricopeptide repeat protein [Saprospiraceae bacterium]|nr:tetratricopeptide repeat protein [Saprospiraceae bacterium]
MKNNNTARNIFLCFLLSLSFLSIKGQETAFHNNTFETYIQGKSYFDQELYGQAIESLELFLYENRFLPDSETNAIYNIDAQSLYHISALRLDLPEAESAMAKFIENHHPNPLLVNAIFEMGDYYYNEKQYVKCIEYFDKIDIDEVAELKMSEVVFKKGYCHFVRKEFNEAQYNFSYTKDLQNRFFYPTNYYYGMCEYFAGDYKGAIKSFQRVESNSVYREQIPYYISQIYFAEENFDQLLNYGENVIRQPGTKKIKEIRLLLGQAYFQRNNYEKALPHLEFHEANTDALTIEEFYQLAFAQYQSGFCDRAIDNFLEINLEDSKLGQVVNYYLADCYEKKGDKSSARAAFKKVSQMNYDQGMQEESTFNYGKLSAELGFEREAINILITIEERSPYYAETQDIINDILVNTGDFENAISILESLPSLNKKLEETYQKVTFNLGLQLLAENKKEDTKAMFAKSMKYTHDASILTQIVFWEAAFHASEGNYKESISSYKRYHLFQRQAPNLPEESSPYMARYYNAYNHLKLGEYLSAVDEFKSTIILINQEQTQIKNGAIKNRILPDAYLRAGDCLFKENMYDDAVTYYDQSIQLKANGYDYALYQRGLIEGLVGQPFEKILTLEELIETNPDSDYADDAYWQLGDTYLAVGNPINAANAFRTLRTDFKGRSNLINAANLKLGLINYNQGDMEGALAYYKSVFQNNPNPKESQEALVSIEEIYIDDLGKTEEYFNFLQTIPGYELTAFSKDSLDYRIGEIQYQNANYAKAVDAFNEYLSKYKAGYYRLEARYYRGESHALLKNYSKALTDYEVIIQEGISDNYERALKKAALISYNHSQNFNKALQYYTLLESHTSSQEDAYQAQLGAMRSAFRLGKDEDVITYANKVTTNSLVNKDEKSTAMYYLGKVSYKKVQLQQAAAAFAQVAELSNNNQAAESRYMIAKILFEQSAFQEAEQAANDANEKNANYPTWIAKSILLLADIYIENGDLLNARAAAEAVAENFKDDEELLKIANATLVRITQKEQESNRIKIEIPDGTLELDTTGN